MKVIKAAERKTYQRDSELIRTVADIMDRVKTEGDAALLSYAERFDHVQLPGVRVSPETVKAAYDKVDPETVEAIRFAAGAIRYFAEQQKTCLKDLHIQSKVEGLEVGHRMIPVDRCGCYVPGRPSSASQLRADGYRYGKGGRREERSCLLSGGTKLRHDPSGGSGSYGHCRCR